MQKIAILTLLSLFSYFRAEAQLRLSGLFTDHAVLQRDKPLPVWGWAAPGEVVQVKFNGQTLTAKTTPEGRWLVTFGPSEAGGPYTLEVTGKKDKISLQDLLVGDVWLCSGQSNMEWNVYSAANAPAEVRAANFPNIRHLKVARGLSLQPENDLPAGSTAWQVCSPATVGEFTAVGYYFARELTEKLGKDVPIGLLHSSWGGSQVEGWISKQGMLDLPDLREYGLKLPPDWPAADALLERRVRNYTLGQPDLKPTAEDEAHYTDADYDFSKWPAGYAPGAWDWQGIWAFRGRGFMAREVSIPADLGGQAAKVSLGVNDQPFELWINGQLVAKTQQKGVIQVEIPEKILVGGKNKFVLKMGSNADPEWWSMGLHGNNSDLHLDLAGEKISLAGDGWCLMPAWSEPFHFEHLCNNLGTTLYNAMIHPLAPYPLRGTLWYQGESNAVRAHQYRASFPAMIQDWRRLWQDEFPFLFVQLSSYGRNQSSNEGSLWAELREAQTLTLQLPYTRMAVTTDIGNADDIHPTNKQDVGKRLALNALDLVYGQTGPARSPAFRSVTWEAASAVLTFDDTADGLVAKDKFGYVRGFEIAGEDKVFRYAQAQIVNGNQIVVFHPEGKKPVSVRYAWADAPTDVNVFNSANLPLGTFRTDDWPGNTVGKKFE